MEEHNEQAKAAYGSKEDSYHFIRNLLIYYYNMKWRQINLRVF
jgi:hypothetical protein